MNPKSPFSQRRRVDLPGILLAVGLLAAMGGWWLYLSHNARIEREHVLASVPDFPKRGEPPRERRPAAARPRVTPPAKTATAIVATAPKPAPTLSAAQRFVLNNDRHTTAGLLQFNALMNAPLIEKLDKCFPRNQLQAIGRDAGFDVTRDIDTIAFTGKAEIITGFFGDNPQDTGLGCEPNEQTSPPTTYRGFTVMRCGNSTMAFQSSVFLNADDPSVDMNSLIDKALDPPPSGADADDVYGDIYMRIDPSDASTGHSSNRFDTLLNAVLAQASGLTLRANVWDSVALTMEADPSQGTSPSDLAATTNAAIALARDSVDGEDVALSTYADLAKVQVQNGKLNVNVALPTDKLVEELNGVCERERKRARESETKEGEKPRAEE
jgi:hypothetical protein